MHINADVPARREPQLALAGEQHVPGLVLLLADQGVLAVGAELARLLRAQVRWSSRQARQYSGPPPSWKCQRQRALIRFCCVQQHLAERELLREALPTG